MSGMPQKLVNVADSSTTLARVSAPSQVMLLKPTLHSKRHTKKCQRALTVEIRIRARESIPQRPQRLIHIEHLGDRNDAVSSVGAIDKHIQTTKLVVIQAVSRVVSKSKHCQRALTVRIRAESGVLELCEGAIHFEALCEILGALVSDVVAIQTAYKKQALSAGLDSGDQGKRQRKPEY